MVAAAVEETDTTATPGPTPNSRPAVIVSGTAGSASTSRTVYTPPYAAYLRSAFRFCRVWGLVCLLLCRWQRLHLQRRVHAPVRGVPARGAGG